jgi:hypothetical protein
MKLRTIVVSTLLAGAALAGPAAHAQVVQNTIPLVLHDDHANGFSAVFGNIYGAENWGASFIDTFTFSVDHPTEFAVTGSLISLHMDMAPPPGQTERMSKYLVIRRFSLYSYDAATNTVGAELAWPDGNADRFIFDGAWHLTPGTYAVQVRGDIVGNYGGSYSADLALMPVPEPQTWGMLLAGLGALGAMARRRKA